MLKLWLLPTKWTIWTKWSPKLHFLKNGETISCWCCCLRGRTSRTCCNKGVSATGTRGQLISKQNFWVVTSPKKPKVTHSGYLVTAGQFCFKVYWPLALEIGKRNIGPKISLKPSSPNELTNVSPLLIVKPSAVPAWLIQSRSAISWHH